jgi:mono/diheme cytochrome c family protein
LSKAYSLHLTRPFFPSVVLLCSLAPLECTEAGYQQVAQREGKRIAEDWCSECHRVSPDQLSRTRRGHVLPPPVAAPSFMQITAKPDANEAYLRNFVSELHLPMPTFRLSDEQRHDVIAYMLSR